MAIFALERLDPRSKIIIMLCISTLAMVTESIRWLLLLVLFSVMILIFGGSEIPRIFNQVKSVFIIIISLFIIQTVFVRSGTPLFYLNGFVIITRDGVLLASMLSLRLLVLVFCALIILTGDPRDYLLAMVQCKVPYEIAFMVMVTIHFIPILREEALNVFYTVQLRGIELKKASLKYKLRIYSHISLPILVCALNRVKTMSLAMEAKAFRAYPQRTYMRRLFLTIKDKIILFLFPAATLGIIIYGCIL